jgi:hypothetical protein
MSLLFEVCHGQKPPVDPVLDKTEARLAGLGFEPMIYGEVLGLQEAKRHL